MHWAATALDETLESIPPIIDHKWLYHAVPKEESGYVSTKKDAIL